MADAAPIQIFVKRDHTGQMIACDKNGRLLDHQMKVVYTVSVNDVPMVTVTMRGPGIIEHD